MSTADWKPCPIDMSDLDLSGDGLRQHWDVLHAGCPEPFPQNPAVQDAWRHFHLGQFAQAFEVGTSVGGVGLLPALFALTIHTHYLESEDKRRVALFKQGIKLCEEAEESGLESANLNYVYAAIMGRYSQSISVIEALAQGFGGKIKEQLQKCLTLESKHAEGHATFAGWHAAISDQAGALMARMLYGATQDAAHEHYEQAIGIAPQDPVLYAEYSRGVEVMYGEKDPGVRKYLEESLELPAINAVRRLDRRVASERLALLS